MFRAPTSPTPSAASGGASRLPPSSPVSPVPPMRRPAASASAGAAAHARPGAGAGARRALVEPRWRGGSGDGGMQQQQQPPLADKYDRLALIEAGWDPADAAAACAGKPKPRACSSRGLAGGASASSVGGAGRRGGSGSVAGSSRSVGAAGAGPRKTDRVNRYRELAEQWDRDRWEARRPLCLFAGSNTIFGISSVSLAPLLNHKPAGSSAPAQPGPAARRAAPS
jgi:hypothetical protein